MRLIERLEEVDASIHGGALTIGNFDGVHRGHAEIVRRLCESARSLSRPSVVLTFDPHPARILRPEQAPPPLTWLHRKAELLSELGVDVMIACAIDREFLQRTAQEFFETIVRRAVRARALVEGPNFYFGHNRTGDVKLLAQLCRQHDLTLEIVPPLLESGEFISSSRVRQAIREGNVTSAASLLTRPYRLRGMVVHGAHRGGKLGFPTANLDAIDTLVPAHGVYAGSAWHRNVAHAAAIHIGPLPTFGVADQQVEVHLIGFEGSLYGETLEVDFHRRVRDVQRFESVAELQRQLTLDVEQCRAVMEQRE